ncbi:MAG: hypothetical protein ACN6OP_19365 [Pseudomonadales bacterium]
MESLDRNIVDSLNGFLETGRPRMPYERRWFGASAPSARRSLELVAFELRAACPDKAF